MYNSQKVEATHTFINKLDKQNVQYTYSEFSTEKEISYSDTRYNMDKH